MLGLIQPEVNYMSCISKGVQVISPPMEATSYDTFQRSGPLYRSVQRQIMDVLARGEWRPNEAIPSEKRLCDRFGVSIGTLRKAIDVLVADHLLVRHQGLGTFVASHNRPRQFFQFFNIGPHEGQRTYPEVKLLDFRKSRADKLAASKLGIEAGDPVFRLRNLLAMNAHPVVVDTLVLPASLFDGLTEPIVRNRPNTLYNLYLDAYGLNIIHIDERVRAAAAPAASARLLGLSVGAPILEVRRIAFSFNRQPIEWRISHVDTRHHEYVHRDGLQS